MQVVDAEIRDMELIYAFATMEQADKAEALAILPDVLDGTAKRKDVQAALKAVLSSNVETGPEEDKRTGDLFADQEQESAPPCHRKPGNPRASGQAGRCNGDTIDTAHKIVNN
jgi:hypothetical protein